MDPLAAFRRRRRRPIYVRVAHLSTLNRASSVDFADDVDAALRLDPHWVSLTEVGRRRADLREVIAGTGYKALHFESRETCFLYAAHAGVQVLDAHEWQAHPGGKGYPARYLTEGEFGYRGEVFNAFTGHWLAHLADSAARVRDHEKMTALAVEKMLAASRGRSISTLGCDANEADHPGTDEDKALGTMATQFRKAGITTVWDEVKHHPSTFGKRDPIDLLATVDADGRVSVEEAMAVDVRGDHDLIAAVLKVRRG